MSAEHDGWYDSADGLRLFYRHHGATASGLAVLCLPGITRNSRDFEDLAAHLAARHPVICPDFRGRGHSARDPDWRNYQPRTYAGDVLRLLDHLRIGRAAFIGTSLGGIVSTLVAAADGGRVAGIVLNDIGPEIGPAGLARIMGYIGRAAPVADWDEALAQAREIYSAAWPDLDDAKWRRLVRRSYREDDDGVPVLDMDPMIGEAARSVGTGLDDPWQLFAALANTPAMLLQGELSDILTDEIVTRMRERKRDLRHVVVRGRGHVPLLDEPECIAAIDHFLAGIR